MSSVTHLIDVAQIIDYVVGSSADAIVAAVEGFVDHILAAVDLFIVGCCLSIRC